MCTVFSYLNSEAYQTFEGNLKELLCKPLEGLFACLWNLELRCDLSLWENILILLVLTEILSAYGKLKDTASENELRNFLSSFKDHAPQVKLNNHLSHCMTTPNVLYCTMNCCKPLWTGVEETSSCWAAIPSLWM